MMYRDDEPIRCLKMLHIEQYGLRCFNLSSKPAPSFKALECDSAVMKTSPFFHSAQCLACEVVAAPECIQPEHGEKGETSTQQSQNEEELESLPRTS